MGKQLVRKCDCCELEIPINQQTIGELIYFDKKTYHKDCFANLCRQKITNQKCKSDKWENALNNITELRINTIEHFKPLIIKDAVYRIILSIYNPSFIPNKVWIKLDAIYNGKLNGMTRPIPPKHLMDMWQRQSKKLLEIHKKMEQSGNEMDTVGMIMYDLSVLVNKYDSYLKWLEKQRIIEMERRNAEMYNASIKQIVDPNIIKMSQDHNADDTDIAALVDEIFD